MDKKIRIDDGKAQIHRLLGRIPAVFRPGGFWIVNASVNARAPQDGFSATPERRFEFFSLSHLFEGGGRLWLADGTLSELTPGDAVLIAPGVLNRYGGDAGLPYCEDSIRFSGPAADAMAAAGLLKSGVYRLGAERVLCELADLCADPSDRAQLLAAAKLQTLLLELTARRPGESHDRCGELLEALRQHPEHWWTVEEMAEFMAVRPPVLRKLFLSRTGLLPKNYVERLKLNQAAAMLLRSSLSIRDAASRFGYQDAYHFSRRFKYVFGVSPEHYRREYRNPR